MFSRLKKNLHSSYSYLTITAVYFLVPAALVLLLSDSMPLAALLIIFLLIIHFIFLALLAAKRKKELNLIQLTIRKIREEGILNPEDIILGTNLQELQEEIREMFEKIRSNIEYLKKLEKMRTEFIANTSHELRTPVFAIHGFIETLLNGALEDTKVNRLFLEKANKHAVNLSNLLNDLIDISMIESGEMRMHFRYFHVNEFVPPILEEMKPLAEEKNLELVFVPAGKNLSLFGDKEKLKQVLVNLIQNALKYTEKGRVEVLIEDEPRFGVIKVRDSGIGIPDEDIKRIFERFYRIDKARSKEVGGTGLGLAIVKHIIEAHNSSIQVKSTLNAGSEFSFRLKK